MTLIEWLATQGVTIARAETGAIRLPSGKTAFVTESAEGKITIRHPGNAARAQSYYQRANSWASALKLIRANVR